MSAIMPIKTVLFDLDDTLNDRRLSWAAFVPVFQLEYAHRMSECEQAEIERTILAADRGGYRAKAEFFGELCEKLAWNNRPGAGELEIFWRQHFGACTVERAGAKKLLEDLRHGGIQTGIVSNGTVALQSAKIATRGLHKYVDAVVISEAIGVKKPDAKIFQEALRMLSATSESTLFVGDHPVLDIAGPAALGMRTAWLKLGRDWPSEISPPGYVISDLHELRLIAGLE